jgi:hypothetical protein
MHAVKEGIRMFVQVVTSTRARSLTRFSLCTGLIIFTACVSEPQRPGSEPLGPEQAPDVVGSYSATSIWVERDGMFTNLSGEPDTRIDLHLNADGSVHGQLKIGTDPQLRTKQELVGTWRLSIPNRVMFDFTAPTFLEEMAFEVSGTRLTGDWQGEDVRVRIELERVS